MNLRLLAKILGFLLLLLGALQAVCLGVAWVEADYVASGAEVQGFIRSIEITVGVSLVFVLVGIRSGRDLLRKEAIAVVGLGWMFCATFGALPFVFCPPNLSYVDGVFESMSGFTTTGASVISDIESLGRGLMFWRCMTQWLGGMGIIVLFVALLSYLGVGGKAIFRHESSGKDDAGFESRIRDVALKLWQIYLGLSVLCCGGLMAMGMNWFDAVCHTFATVSTGGFGTYNDSVMHFNHLGIELWLTLFMILGGISFMLYAWILQGRWERWKKEEETKYFLILLGIASFSVATNLYLQGGGDSYGAALRVSVFQVVSIMTTTGFVTADFNQWPAFSMMVLLLLMILGGCAGSTAGGVKLSRWILFLKILRIELTHIFRPNQVFSTKLNGNAVETPLQTQTVFFIALAGVTCLISSVMVSLLEPGIDLISAFSATLATLFNIGPGLGVVGPVSNFSALMPGTKILLVLLMVLGRLEFFAVLVLFMPSLWRKY